VTKKKTASRKRKRKALHADMIHERKRAAWWTRGKSRGDGAGAELGIREGGKGGA